VTTARPFLAENQHQSARLRALVTRMTDGDLERPVGPEWTVADALLHLAFWDLRAAVLVDRFERQGVTPSPADVDVINETVHAMTRALPPRATARLAVEAAERIDQGLRAMSDRVLEALPEAGPPFSLDRHAHREEHLDEIEGALRQSRSPSE
jgi:mycothiol maleylpyruvate isomerase-like protein